MAIKQGVKDEIQRTKPGELVNLDRYTFNDDDMEQLADLLMERKHTKVSIRRSNITDVGVIHLVKCTDLVYLSLDENSVGDKGVQKLLTLPKLRELHLCTNDLTDAGARLISTQCGKTFRASIHGNRRVTKELIQEISSKWKFYDPDSPKSSLNSQDSGYS